MNKKERQALASLLRAQREKLGVSARELARRAGIDNATITLLENCRIASPRIETVRALAEVMDLPLADVYAVANWMPNGALPSLVPYMRAKYGDLTDAELRQVEIFVNELSERSSGPRPGEDE